MIDSQINNTVIYNKGITYTATMGLRWYVPDAVASAMGYKVLQQAHQGDDGSVEWREVPIERGNG